MFAVLISESIVFRMYDRTDDEVVRGRRGKRVLSSLHASVSDLGRKNKTSRHTLSLVEHPSCAILSNLR